MGRVLAERAGAAVTRPVPHGGHPNLLELRALPSRVGAASHCHTAAGRRGVQHGQAASCKARRAGSPGCPGCQAPHLARPAAAWLRCCAAHGGARGQPRSRHAVQHRAGQPLQQPLHHHAGAAAPCAGEQTARWPAPARDRPWPKLVGMAPQDEFEESTALPAEQQQAAEPGFSPSGMRLGGAALGTAPVYRWGRVVVLVGGWLGGAVSHTAVPTSSLRSWASGPLLCPRARRLCRLPPTARWAHPHWRASAECWNACT